MVSWQTQGIFELLPHHHCCIPPQNRQRAHPILLDSNHLCDSHTVHPVSILLHQTVGQPFCVMFLNAQISRCQGCRGTIEQGQSSPGDIVLQHKEYVLFQNPRTGSWQMSKELRNTYYRPRMGCTARCNPCFNCSEIQVR